MVVYAAIKSQVTANSDFSAIERLKGYSSQWN